MSTLPSCLELVNRVLEEVGDVTVASLDPGSRNSKIALEAMNDACTIIWERARWPWSKQTATFALVPLQADYALPTRYDRLCEPPRIVGVNSYQNLTEQTPELWNVKNLGAPDPNGGTPRWFKIDDTQITLFPVPNADFIDIYPNLTFAYFQEAPDRKTTANDADSWDVPGKFYDLMVRFGCSRVKQYTGAPDWMQDMENFERRLAQQLARMREGRVPAQVRPLNYVVSTW